MTSVWIAVAAVALAAALTVLALARRRHASGAGRAAATLSNLEDSTTLDSATGAVRSLQTADLVLEERALREIWSPMHLERLARTYWRFLTRVTLGLIRVRYTEHERSLVLVAWPLRLMTFQAPEYEMDPARGLVRWRIARGLLVAKRGCDGGGYLQIEVRRSPAEDPDLVRLHVEIEVANFYPSIAAGLGRWLYEVTQSRIHVLITHGFLRSLARLDLAESKVGRLAPDDIA
jgi:hypothetical protein